MNKTLTVIKPYGWMEPGETFELSEDGKMYTNTHTTEYNSVCKNNDITSKATTVYSISPDFAKALINFDNIIITDIYAAREKNTFDISATNLVEKINSLGKKAIYISSFDEIAKYIKTRACPYDIVLTMGAGTVNEIGKKILL